MAEIVRMSCIVVTDAGEFSVATTHPSPGGGNPRFVTAQLRSGLEVLGRRLDAILVAEHGPQHVEPPRRPQPGWKPQTVIMTVLAPPDAPLEDMIEHELFGPLGIYPCEPIDDEEDE